ncbi:ABC transporter permease [bacterium]|nr:ABC transporter permease [bacterium]
MKAIWLIGRQSLQFLIKDKTSLIWFLIVPVMYIAVFGYAFRHTGSDPSQYKADLAVYNRDGGLFAKRFISYLKSENLVIDSLTQIPQNPPVRMITIPDTFSANLQAEKPVVLEFQKRSDANAQASMTAEMAVRKAYFRLLADMAQLRLSRRKISNAGFQILDQRVPILTVNSEYAGRHVTIPQGFSQQVPAQIIQFTTLMLFIYAGSAILEEKNRGLLRRIKTTPIRFWQIFLGKLLFILLLGLTQSLLILGIGRFVFGVYLGSSLASLAGVLIVFILAIGSIGLCLGFFIRNPEKMVGLAIISGLAMASLSGCWWPIEVMPTWMQRMATVLPTGMALKALHSLISFGKGVSDILPYLIGLLLTAGLFSLIFGRFLLKYQEG